MKYTLEQTTPPTGDVVTLAEAKLHLHVVHTEEDTLIQSLINAAVGYAERYTRRCLLTQSWTMSMDCFPYNDRYNGRLDYFNLPRSPLVSITSLSYTDADDATIIVPTTVYGQDNGKETPARVFLKANQIWPTDLARQRSTVRTVFECGYGEAEDVPDEFKAAIKLMVGNWFENREEVITGTIATKVPKTVDILLNIYRIYEDNT